ncbi:MAG TPA: exosortase family protein XrtF [Cyclobacteriaceae bacterium]|nr:exosortase family protein XrtF [Cyclobacteriaceae bacterium]HMV08957.1 exosortase family protein XrtF [Cyclobacteriaceae bacterium]HMV90152.1 exosortase family protein XrtF [Cyclobacteriaceae bacterium]HMX00288.1 exosortase family protein XrtF [Cyclobacteriaceae bacterium]HMX49713.1 exosortase family protein XrtF [Cyclobacteriaceae bacterium]
MKTTLISQFKPTILFLVKFLGMYVAGSLLYGWFVTYYNPAPDPVTIWVTNQTAFLIRVLGWNVVAMYSQHVPTVSVVLEVKSIISVYEGCSGINVIIIFWSFLFAFGPWGKRLIFFAVTGALIIHVANLIRVCVLFFVAYYYSNALYFFHKYLFTAAIYVVVLLLWLWWIRNLKKRETT